MLILHLTPGGIPDARLERAAYSMKKRNCNVYLLAGKSTTYNGPFDRCFFAPLGNDLLTPIQKHKWMKTIKNINPDIIHAHNISVARFLLGSDYPIVYDDHEFWSLNFPLWYHMRPFVRKIFSLHSLFLIPKWEQQLLTKYPTLTVSEPIAESHKAHNNTAWVKVTLNYPSLFEVAHIKDRENRFGLVYEGTDIRKRFGVKNAAPYRDMSGLPSCVYFDRIYGLSYSDLLTRLTHYQIGIIPWNPHQIHHLVCPAKAFDYLHAGLQVISPRTMTILKDIPYVHFFDSLNEIPAIIEQIELIPSSEIIAYAREHHVWESQEANMILAYKEAIRRKQNENC